MKWGIGIYWFLTAVTSLVLTTHQMIVISSKFPTLPRVEVNVFIDTFYTEHVVTIPDLKLCTPGTGLPESYFVIWVPSVCWLHRL